MPPPELADQLDRLKGAGGNVCRLPKEAKDSLSATRYKYETMAKLFGLGKGFRVLDWGSGCGFQIDNIAGKYGFEGVGIDMSSAPVTWASKNLKNAKTHCK